MNDLISRQAANDAMAQLQAGAYSKAEFMAIRKAWKRIKKLPPAEPEIIYCKDCRHRDDHGCCKYWKGLSMGETLIATDDDDFCSYAERRNDVFVER